MVFREFQGALRQADAHALASDLARALGGSDVTLDLSQVTQADAGIVQVLISASALADRTGRRLHLDMPEGCAVWTMAQALALPQVGLPMPMPMPMPYAAPVANSTDAKPVALEDASSGMTR